VYYPNQALSSAKFVNLTKSGTKWEVIYVYVDGDTDPSILIDIENECARVREEKKGEYGPGFRVKFGAAEPPFKVGLEMVFEYSHQGINFHRTACARSWMYEAFFRVLTDHGVKYTWPRTAESPAAQADSSVGGRGPMMMASAQGG
jgi:small-conductance mechanosensitive channel